MTQVSKCLMLGVVELINCFYTWGTGLVIIDSSLYLLLEVGLFLDLLYHLLVFDSPSRVIEEQESQEKKPVIDQKQNI